MNNSMRKTTVTTKQTVCIIALSTVPIILFLSVITVLGDISVVRVLVYEDMFDIIDEKRCEFDLHTGGALLDSLYVLELVVMMYGLYLCYLIRDIPDTISNSRAIAKCTFKALAYVLFIMLVLFILLLVLIFGVVFLFRYLVHSDAFSHIIRSAVRIRFRSQYQTVFGCSYICVGNYGNGGQYVP
jgi:hypothetical protein